MKNWEVWEDMPVPELVREVWKMFEELGQSSPTSTQLLAWAIACAQYIEQGIYPYCGLRGDQFERYPKFGEWADWWQAASLAEEKEYNRRRESALEANPNVNIPIFSQARDGYIAAEIMRQMPDGPLLNVARSAMIYGSGGHIVQMAEKAASVILLAVKMKVGYNPMEQGKPWVMLLGKNAMNSNPSQPQQKEK